MRGISTTGLHFPLLGMIRGFAAMSTQPTRLFFYLLFMDIAYAGERKEHLWCFIDLDPLLLIDKLLYILNSTLKSDKPLLHNINVWAELAPAVKTLMEARVSETWKGAWAYLAIDNNAETIAVANATPLIPEFGSTPWWLGDMFLYFGVVKVAIVSPSNDYC